MAAASDVRCPRAHHVRTLSPPRRKDVGETRAASPAPGGGSEVDARIGRVEVSESKRGRHTQYEIKRGSTQPRSMKVHLLGLRSSGYDTRYDELYAGWFHQ